MSKQQLQWTKIERFGGMWTAGDKLLMPPDAAQLLAGCQPQPQGGLRAFFKPVEEGLLGDDAGSMLDAPPTALFGGNFTGIVPLSVFYIAGELVCVFCYSVDVNGEPMPQRPEIEVRGPFRIRHNGGGEFFLADAFPGEAYQDGPLYPNNVLPNPVLLRPVSSAASAIPTAYMVICTVPEDSPSAANQGLWSFIDISTAQQAIGGTDIPYLRFAIVHQSRLVIAAHHSVVYSSPGTMDITSAFSNFVNLAGGNVLWMISMPPSDLLVGTTTGAIFNIQGDIDDPVVRTLVPPSKGVGYHHVPVLTRYGPIAITSAGPTVIGTDGAFQPLAESIDRALWQNHGGALAYMEDLLFAPNWHAADENDEFAEAKRNGAMVYDFRTGAWFLSSHEDALELPNPLNITIDPTDEFTTSLTPESSYEPFNQDRPGVVITPTQIIPFGSPPETPLAWKYDTAGQRDSVYEWVSAPMHAPDGREVEVQEVQIGALGFGEDVGSTITVTAANEHGETATVAIDIPYGKRVLSFPIRLKGQYVDFRVKAVNHDGGEAPAIEYVNFGWATRNLPIDKPAGGYPSAYPDGY